MTEVVPTDNQPKMVSFKIHWMTPQAPSWQYKYIFDTMHFRIGLESSHSISSLHQTKPEYFQVHLWTNLYHKHYNEGEWHQVAMTYLGTQQVQSGGKVLYIYGVDLLLTCLGNYGFTYRATSKFDNDFKWSEHFEVDGRVEVRQPVKYNTTWIQEPEMAQITHNIYLGNYTAAMEAPENGFDCLLNMADDAHVYAQQLVCPIIFKKLPVPAGANNVISEHVISYAVRWLRAMSDRCRKIMVCSRNGHGRAGSIVLAFIYFMNPNLTFDEAFTFVDNRFFIYNHKGLRQCIARMFRGENFIMPATSEEDLTNVSKKRDLERRPIRF